MNREKQKELERGHREGSGGKRILPGLVLAAFAAALVTYAVLINLEKNILSAYEKRIAGFWQRPWIRGRN